MVEAVAHQVGQRIDDALGKTLVELGGLALGDQFHVLVELGGQVTHQPREATEYIVHGYHADRHHRFLQIPRIALQQAHAVDHGTVSHAVQFAGGLVEHRLGDDQLADQVDDLVDLVHRHAYRRRLATGCLGLRLATRRLGRRILGRRAGGHCRLGDSRRRSGLTGRRTIATALLSSAQRANFDLVGVDDKAHHRLDIVGAGAGIERYQVTLAIAAL